MIWLCHHTAQPAVMERDRVEIQQINVGKREITEKRKREETDGGKCIQIERC